MTSQDDPYPNLEEVIKYLTKVRNGDNSCCKIYTLGKEKCAGSCPLMDVPGNEGLCGLSIIIQALKNERKNTRVITECCKLNPGDKLSLDKRVNALEEASADTVSRVAKLELWRKS